MRLPAVGPGVVQRCSLQGSGRQKGSGPCMEWQALMPLLYRLQVGLNGIDNGAIRFTNVRVPRDNLLDRFATGTHVAMVVVGC